MSCTATTARYIYKSAEITDRHDMRIEDLYYTGILRKKSKLNEPKGLAESKWNKGHEKETMCIHRGGITHDAMIRKV